MVASYLDSSSGSNVANLISYLNSTNFTLGNGIVLRSTTINDQVTVFSKSDVSPVVVDSSGSSSDALTAAKNSVINN